MADSITELSSGQQQHLSRRFFMVVVFASLAVLAVGTGIEFYHGYRSGAGRIHRNLQFIQESYLPPAATSLYSFDETQLRLLLKGMLKLEGIACCQVVETIGDRRFEMTEGQGEVDGLLPHPFPLVFHQSGGADIPVGTLTVYADFTSISRQQWRMVAVNVITVALMIIISALLVVILFQKMVARHLKCMAEFCQSIDPAHPDTRLRLDRKAGPDELEQVVSALNALLERLREDIERRRQTERLLRESEQRYRSLNENVPVGVFRTTLEGRIISANPALLQMLGVTGKEELPQNQGETLNLYPDDRKRIFTVAEPDGQIKGFEFQLKPLSGRPFWVSLSSRVIRNDHGQPIYVDGVVEDIEARKSAEEKERETKAFRDRIFESSMTPIVVMDPINYRFIECNPAAASIYGFDSVEQALGKIPIDVSAPTQYDGTPTSEKIKYYVEKAISDGLVIFEWRHRRPDGEIWDAEVHLMRFRSGKRQLLQLTLHDITQRKSAEKDKEKLQTQLHQAQKMEAVGHLAGGIAHDFNNMLSVVTGNVELALMRLGPEGDAELEQRLAAIQDAARRSTDLVRQLLAFARKQTINPVVLDINDIIAGMLKVLRRLIGEEIDLAWIPGRGVGRVRMDPSQIDQILANLMVNARDAIGGVGIVTIETDNIILEAADCIDQTDCKPGRYALLSVSDTGCGMSADTLSQIFEPFFTTKGIGRGTGLGLATIYGIVKQNNGFIRVYSEPNQGATFKIYFPAVDETVAEIPSEEQGQRPPEGTETLLVVEDDESILMLAESILSQLGYTVITAETPGMAIEIAQTHGEKIDLLLTDVIMPKMNGRELAECIGMTHPGIKCLFMSGYTADIIAHKGVLDGDVHFISKPFSIKALALKVREVLDS